MRALRSYLADTRGAAALEFGLVLSMLTLPMLSVIDIGIYTYDKMQLQNAAQMGSQSVWATCTTDATWPVTKYCSAAQTAITSAAQTTSLGTNVTVSTTVEGYYCVDGNGVPQPIGSTGTFASPLTATAPTSCGSGTWTSKKPADYISVTAAYTYTPVFSGISVASLLTPSLTSTSTIPVK
ncbi:MAG TPA: TadE/TadG family type IV pilus assembly protein [Caulobacteraceae bacterium]